MTVVQYRVSFSISLVPQLQLCHLQWLVSKQSVGVLHSQLLYVLHFVSGGDAAPIVETHQRLHNVDCRAGVPATTVQAPTVKSMSQYSPYVYAIIIRSQLALLYTVCTE
jgi:hypothetical protein